MVGTKWQAEYRKWGGARVRRLLGFDEAEAIVGERRAGSNGAIVWRSVEACHRSRRGEDQRLS